MLKYANLKFSGFRTIKVEQLKNKVGSDET